MGGGLHVADGLAASALHAQGAIFRNCTAQGPRRRPLRLPRPPPTESKRALGPTKLLFSNAIWGVSTSFAARAQELYPSMTPECARIDRRTPAS